MNWVFVSQKAAFLIIAVKTSNLSTLTVSSSCQNDGRMVIWNKPFVTKEKISIHAAGVTKETREEIQ
jgi:hypothetical protein